MGRGVRLSTIPLLRTSPPPGPPPPAPPGTWQALQPATFRGMTALHVATARSELHALPPLLSRPSLRELGAAMLLRDEFGASPLQRAYQARCDHRGLCLTHP